MSSMNINETVVHDFHQMFNARNRKGLTALLHSDFTFTSPQDDSIDAAAYFERCWSVGDKQADFEIDSIAAVNQFVFVHYLLTTTDGAMSSNVERFTIEDDKVRAIELFLGGVPRKNT